jgi:hypothetical protein
MFPILITVQNEAQLAAVKAALAGAPAPAKPAAAKPAAPAKTTAAAPATKSSAPPAAQAKAAAAADKPQAPVDMKALGTAVTHIADDFLEGEGDSAVNIGRPRIVALLEEFGAKKLNQVPANRMHEFATKVKALAAELEGAQPAAAEEQTESLV